MSNGKLPKLEDTSPRHSAPAVLVEELARRIKKSALDYTEANVDTPTDHDVLFAENAMLIGAGLALELAIQRAKEDLPTPLQGMTLEQVSLEIKRT